MHGPRRALLPFWHIQRVVTDLECHATQMMSEVSYNIVGK